MFLGKEHRIERIEYRIKTEESRIKNQDQKLGVRSYEL